MLLFLFISSSYSLSLTVELIGEKLTVGKIYAALLIYETWREYKAKIQRDGHARTVSPPLLIIILPISLSLSSKTFHDVTCFLLPCNPTEDGERGLERDHPRGLVSSESFILNVSLSFPILPL